MEKMTKTTSSMRITFSCILSTLLWLPLLASAQNQTVEEEPNWYQIEIIVFEHRMYAGNSGDPEVWPKNLMLAYPPGTKHILTQEELEAMEEESMAENDSMEPSTDNPLTEKPFVQLDDVVSQLTRELSAIDRERDMRVLVHKAWRQPIGKKQDAPSIVMLGGDQYDGHYELEGTLQFSVSRYLHMDTNLWLTRFEANLGQEDSSWPQLPEVPEKRLGGNELDALYNENVADLDGIHTPWDNDPVSNNAETGSLFGGLNNNPFGTEQAGTTYPASRGKYAIVDIVKLSQTRRMRSAELHYVDHPHMGILVRIDTYKIAEPNESTDSEE